MIPKPEHYIYGGLCLNPYLHLFRGEETMNLKVTYSGAPPVDFHDDGIRVKLEEAIEKLLNLVGLRVVDYNYDLDTNKRTLAFTDEPSDE